MLVLTAAEVDELLDRDDLDAALRQALIALSEGRESVPPRVSAVTPNGRVTAMPGYLPEVALCLKAVSICMPNAERGRPTHQAVILEFDENTGDLRAVLDGTVITGTRTAAAAAIAADTLAREDARTLAVIGAGAQGRAHMEAFARIRPWRDIRVAARTPAKAEKLAADFAGARAVAEFREAVEGADAVCLCTDAPDPVISLDWLAPGCHVGSVGHGHEIDKATLEAGTLFVEWLGAATNPQPAGALELQGMDTGRLTMVGSVLSGAAAGRTDAAQLTVYKSTGHAVQDAAAVRVVLDRAAAVRAGLSVHI